MGVVRREGEWRLEKVEEGHYELTHRGELEGKVLTPDYDPGFMDDASMGMHAVYEVDSYAEAEGVFEEHARGDSRLFASDRSSQSLTESDSTGDSGFSGARGGSSGSSATATEDVNLLPEGQGLPPGAFALVLLLSGLIVLGTYGSDPSNPAFLFALAMLGVGALILGWAAFLGRADGWRAAFDFLSGANTDTGTSETGSESGDQSSTRTPVPDPVERDLIFNRAEQNCEWCDESTDHPEIHHIEQQSEGGSNERSNLMVMCPSCHRKADSGGISKTKLRQKMRVIRSNQ